jgi:hypothetical protein
VQLLAYTTGDVIEVLRAESRQCWCRTTDGIEGWVSFIGCAPQSAVGVTKHTSHAWLLSGAAAEPKYGSHALDAYKIEI